MTRQPSHGPAQAGGQLKLTRDAVKEGLPAPETRQLVLDIRVLAQLVRDPPTRQGVPTTTTTTAAGAGVVRSADKLFKENDLGHDPYLVVGLGEEVEPDTGQPDPEWLIPGGEGPVIVIVVFVSMVGDGPGLALVTGTPKIDAVLFRGRTFRVGDCCPAHANTLGPAKVAPGIRVERRCRGGEGPGREGQQWSRPVSRIRVSCPGGGRAVVCRNSSHPRLLGGGGVTGTPAGQAARCGAIFASCRLMRLAASHGPPDTASHGLSSEQACTSARDLAVYDLREGGMHHLIHLGRLS